MINSLEPRESTGVFVPGRAPVRYAAPQRTRDLRRTPTVPALEGRVHGGGMKRMIESGLGRRSLQ